ncbi:hypothetical protein C7H62_2635 [Mesoflavibacter sp. HG96]|uniref:hypothetical protein n=1 Tax=unclassified Mesoflavibacter TaxID=2630131 RepID=UPI000D1114E0|nr:MULTISPECIES: hypothetical protein [unclassified Mesoflavibacter]QIJ90443.1 hypothetical protein C7H62_2635 [Mesoflavibacter sp. HG96]QIJ93171.1 hypothetical protein C7H56_2635 [Mesoflavibacter sp. HG37]
MKLKLFFYICFLSIIVSCNSLKTAVYDQYSYQQTISVKVESEALIEKAIDSFSHHEAEVNDLILDLKKLVEYEKNKPNNEITYAMLKLMEDQDKSLLAGFLKRWEDEQQLSQVFTNEAKAQIMEAFDLIIKYEANKNKENKTNLLSFLGN